MLSQPHAISSDARTATLANQNTLDSLIHHIDVQEERIESILESRFQPLEKGDEMVALWDEVWGNSDLCLDATHEIKRDLFPDRVNNSLIGDAVPDKFDVMVLPRVVDQCLGIRCCKILIRPNEYEEAEQSAVEASQGDRCHGFLVTGQPGIGLFLSTLSLHDLRVFIIRQIGFSTSSPLAASCPQTPHCPANCT